MGKFPRTVKISSKYLFQLNKIMNRFNSPDEEHAILDAISFLHQFIEYESDGWMPCVRKEKVFRDIILPEKEKGTKV